MPYLDLLEHGAELADPRRGPLVESPQGGPGRHVRPLPPTPEDLFYSLEFVRQELPDLPSWAKDLHAEWVEIYTEGGWSVEDAERAAFRRVTPRTLAR